MLLRLLLLRFGGGSSSSPFLGSDFIELAGLPLLNTHLRGTWTWHLKLQFIYMLTGTVDLVLKSS